MINKNQRWRPFSIFMTSIREVSPDWVGVPMNTIRYITIKTNQGR